MALNKVYDGLFTSGSKISVGAVANICGVGGMLSSDFGGERHG